jgi:hypothetical protein
MRLATVQPAYFYRDLDEHAYVCECGQTVTKAGLKPLAAR